jgi:hypothetical protein
VRPRSLANIRRCKRRRGAKSALASLIAAIGLVDDVDPALPAHQAIIPVPAAQGLKGIADFHDNLGCYLRATYAGDRALSTQGRTTVVRGISLPYSPARSETVQRSRDRFLTTHTGSLPRPDDLIRMMYAKEEGVPVDPAALAARVKAAVTNIPAEQLRMHLCWGNYEGPHHRDVPLADIIDIVLKAKPVAISFEAANPRHAHEWTVFESVELPDGKVLIPGVIESKSNFIEHPEVIAQRIGRYAKCVGRENVIAGSDCGYGTWVGQAAVDPDVVFAKLKGMADGAALATRQFWK